MFFVGNFNDNLIKNKIFAPVTLKLENGFK